VFQYALIAARLLFAVWAAPAVMCANVTALFVNWEAMKAYKVVRSIKITAAAVVGTALLAFATCGVVIHLGFEANMLDAYERLETEAAINASHHALCCSSLTGGWSLFELAGLAVLAHTDPAQSELQKSITDTVFGPGAGVRLTRLPGVLVPGHLVERVSLVPAVVHRGIADKNAVPVLFENVLNYWYTKLASAVIPFFDIAYSLILSGSSGRSQKSSGSRRPASRRHRTGWCERSTARSPSGTTRRGRCRSSRARCRVASRRSTQAASSGRRRSPSSRR